MVDSRNRINSDDKVVNTAFTVPMRRGDEGAFAHGRNKLSDNVEMVRMQPPTNFSNQASLDAEEFYAPKNTPGHGYRHGHGTADLFFRFLRVRSY